jgi:hypothetical protein
MSLEIFKELEQGSEEWFEARCGIVTASVIGQLITNGSPDALSVECPRCQALGGEPCISTARKVPTPIKTAHDERASKADELPPVFTVATGDTARALLMTLAAERITGHVEMTQPSRDMQRGTLDEPFARDAYAEQYEPVDEIGFMVREYAGFKIGYSPDGLVSDAGLIEIKSRNQKLQLKTVLDDAVPTGNMAQIQCGMLVSGRRWIDYVSYCGGMPLYVKRVRPDQGWFDAILEAAAYAEDEIRAMVATYNAATEGKPATERIDHFPDLSIY